MIEPNSIHCGDCLDLLPDIKSGTVDMVLCDLPYGTTQNKWDSVIPLDELFKEYWRVLKSNGCICLFAQQPFMTKLVNASMDEFRYEWVWEKNIVTGFLNARRMPMKSHELIGVFYKKLPTYNPQTFKGKQHSRGGVLEALTIVHLMEEIYLQVRTIFREMCSDTSAIRNIIIPPQNLFHFAST